jgi:urease accessory protein
MGALRLKCLRLLGLRLQPLSMRRIASASAILAASAAPAFAHTGTGQLGGFLSGFEHPIFGIDHLLAMLAVGIWGAQMGGRAVWTLPVVFPMIMAIGGVIGILGIPVPRVEVMIGLSMLGLGLAIALAWKPHEALAIVSISVFAIFHGYAHGAELPEAADPVLYAMGFVIATGLIHVAGIIFGLVLGKLADGWVSRGAGAAIAAAGVYFLTAAVSA